MCCFMNSIGKKKQKNCFFSLSLSLMRGWRESKEKNTELAKKMLFLRCANSVTRFTWQRICGYDIKVLWQEVGEKEDIGTLLFKQGWKGKRG